MIKIENVEVCGWNAAIRGMRNPRNSWDKSDSSTNFHPMDLTNKFYLGSEDLRLAKTLNKNGTSHSKYRRMITVYMDITAPLYWWKEFDTYKVGTVRNSCSSMHTICEKEFELSDFSTEHLNSCSDFQNGLTSPKGAFVHCIIPILNKYREKYKISGNKDYWWQIIQILPSSYNQRSTVMLNYEVLAKIYNERRRHRLDEWVDFCKEIEGLPYNEIIIGDKNDGNE